MLANQVVEESLISAFPDAKVQVEGDGYHYTVTVVSGAFTDVRKVGRQQAVYKALGDKITSGDLHAITINAYTPKEWQEKEHG